MKGDRLLAVGQFDIGSTSCSRLDALRHIFSSVEAVETHPWTNGLSLWKQLMTNHLYLGSHVRSINRQVREAAHRFHPDFLWMDKGLHFWPSTLGAIRGTGCRRLIHFSPDNMMIPANQSRHYLRSIPCYDAHVTTKAHNVEWLSKQGARRVLIMGKGYDPKIHRPIELTPADRVRFGCDVGFVGHWEPSREETLLLLWKRGYCMKVWGGGWEKARRRKHPLFRQSHDLIGEEYAKALCGAKVNLCFLSKWFGDKTTARSVEIPACGGFMLADRNEEHLTLFRQGVEAEFFETQSELIEKIDHYLKYDDQRQAIAQQGRVRCLRGYSNEDRLRHLWNQLEEG